mmetsp:Transcript_4757/g.6622  ORF Transcript_4757/g.6622 Transcript_4757/m.6622 type:complete len:274 (-) Transcript_4757:193-1014(-)|eukprot:CAMPEP_0194049230 /NCGR_PEP_ID=MMETSP0009_2-20130614/30065_1 /TAXON_ID=210454 /ORGANISM="Grammatophora oceanica, Strain CCMP 410" /LENGTH=273 /DNA_ID=CAMNT_0038695335 /DNA_START=232 /DNA_END=1053 /DNA_ORIENTATION=-
MTDDWRGKVICFLLAGLGLTFFVLAYFDRLGLLGEIITGSAVIFLAVACWWSRTGDVSLVRRPRAPVVEMESPEDQELKEDTLRILFPGVPVDEESSILKDSGWESGASEALEDEFACAICLDAIVPGDLVVSGDSCAHVYHHPCVMQWLMKKRRGRYEKNDHNSCPTCRSPMWTEEQYEKAEAKAKLARANNENSTTTKEPQHEEQQQQEQQEPHQVAVTTTTTEPRDEHEEQQEPQQAAEVPIEQREEQQQDQQEPQQSAATTRTDPTPSM